MQHNFSVRYGLFHKQCFGIQTNLYAPIQTWTFFSLLSFSLKLWEYELTLKMLVPFNHTVSFGYVSHFKKLLLNLIYQIYS